MKDSRLVNLAHAFPVPHTVGCGDVAPGHRPLGSSEVYENGVSESRHALQ